MVSVPLGPPAWTRPLQLAKRCSCIFSGGYTAPSLNLSQKSQVSRTPLVTPHCGPNLDMLISNLGNNRVPPYQQAGIQFRLRNLLFQSPWNVTPTVPVPHSEKMYSQKVRSQVLLGGVGTMSHFHHLTIYMTAGKLLGLSKLPLSLYKIVYVWLSPFAVHLKLSQHC